MISEEPAAPNTKIEPKRLRTDMKSVIKLDKEGIQVLLVIIQFKELHPCLLSRTLERGEREREKEREMYAHTTCNGHLSTR